MPPWETAGVDRDKMQRAFDASFDQAIVFHAYTDYMRDYAVYTYNVADPATGIRPSFVRWLFTCCVQATATTALTPEIWRRSLDDRLIDYDTGVDLDGYVWGVKWQRLYPGARLVAESAAAEAWTERVGVAFHEVTIETNGHDLSLVFADLEVWTDVPAGHVPFAIPPDEAEA